MRNILRALCADVTAGAYVFRSVRTGTRINDIKKGFTAACREAGVTDFTFHDLRHTWASRAAEVGVRKHIRREILGHTPKTMTDDYTHASPREMERAMKAVADYSGGSIFNLGKGRGRRGWQVRGGLVTT